MKQETLRKLYIAEMALGVLSMILGALITALVWRQGYYVGALMLVVTGLLSFFLAWREYRGWEGSRTQRTCIADLRRTFLFLNLMLCILVVVTLLSIVWHP